MSSQKPVIPTDADWPVRTVKEMTTLLRRGTAPVYVDESDVMAIGQRCVTNADFDGSRSRPHSGASMLKVLAPEAGDVLINSTGTGTIGRSVIFDDETNKYIVDGHVTVARPRQTDLVSRWLNDVLRSPAGQRYLESRCYAGSTNQVELSSAALGAMPIAIPSVADQCRVADILDVLDAQIRTTEQLLLKVVSLSDGLLDSLTSAVLNFRPTRLSEIILDIRYGTSAPSGADNSGVPVLRIPNIQSGYLNLKDLQYQCPSSDERERYRLSPGDILLIRTNGNPELLGRAACVQEDAARFIFASYLIRIRVDGRRILPEFCDLWLKTDTARRHIRKHAATSAGNYNINIASLKAMKIPCPSLEDQYRVVETMSQAARRLDSESQFLQKLQRLKKGILSDLISGRVVVSEGAA